MSDSKPRVAVVRTGLANLASVLAGLRRAGADPYVTESPEAVSNEAFVMLPGVGAFGPAMEHLGKCGLVEPLRQRVREDRPTLCICLGLQLLNATSDESPGATGLGLLDRHVRRLPAEVRVPHFGWNKLEPQTGCRMITPGYAYFANSFCLPEPTADWSPAYTSHGIRFVGAMERGKVLACQFHPELSGVWGLDLMRRWLKNGAEDCEC